MALIGTLAVNIVAKTSQFVSGMQSSRKELKAFSKTAKEAQATWSTASRMIGAGVALFAGSKIIGSLRQTAEEMDVLAKSADKLGVKTESLAGLRLGAELSGIDVSVLEGSLQRLAKGVSEVSKEGKGAAQGALKELGLEATKLSALTPDVMLNRVADAMGGVTNQSDKIRLSMELFGKSGAPMLEMLKDGASGLEAYKKEAIDLGVALDRESIAKVEEFNDAMTRLQTALGSFSQGLVIDIAPAAQAAIDALTESVAGIKIIQRDRAKRGASGSMWETTANFGGRLMSGDTWAQRGIKQWMINKDIKAGVAMGTDSPDLLRSHGVRGVTMSRARLPFRPEEIDASLGRANQAERKNAEAKAANWLVKSLYEGVGDAAKKVGDKGMAGLTTLAKARADAERFATRWTLQEMFKPPATVETEAVKEEKKKKEAAKLAGEPVFGAAEALVKGTAAAFMAEKSGDRVNALLREQIAIAKAQQAALDKIAANTKQRELDEIWNMSG